MRKVRIAVLMFTLALAIYLFFETETKLALTAPLTEEMVRVGEGFSIAIADVQREEDAAVLYFSITKLTDLKEELSEISVILKDDHDNQYEGMLNIKAGIEDPNLVSDILNSLPIGFTHIEIIRIRMPQAAPIMKISLNDEEFDFTSAKLAKTTYLTDYGALSLSIGQQVEVGEWLFFSISQIEPEISRWELVVDLANNDYNPLSGSVKIGVQEDGIISWSEQTLIEVPGLGQVKTSVVLPISRWKAGELPQPRNLLLQLQDQKTYEQVMKVHPIQKGELPPLVGLSHSPYTKETIFISAYEGNGGKARLGNPTSLVYWFGGGDDPKNKGDILVQEFFSGPQKSVVVWDAQKNFSSAFVVHEPIWEAYTQKGGPYFRSEAQGIVLGAPTSDTTTLSGSYTISGTSGLVNTFEGGAIAITTQGPQANTPIVTMGVFYQKWKEMGLVQGVLGFPLDKETVISVSGASLNTAGWVQNFEGGLIVHHSLGEYAGKTFVTYGSICRKYQELSALNSDLGFPVMDQYQSVTGWPQGEFEGGYIATADGHSFRAFTYPPGKVAFVSDRDGNTEIYTIDLRGRNLVKLTKNPANDWYPKWSPSGKEIVFVSERNPQGIYIMNADGSNQRFITQGEDPSWFPDGNRIVFTKLVLITQKSMLGDLTRSLHRMFISNTDGTDVREVKINLDSNSVSRDLRYPIVSPDGSRIVFYIGEQLYLVKIDGTGLQEIPITKAHEMVSWAPDGRRIAYRQSTGIVSHSKDIKGVSIKGGPLYTVELNTASNYLHKAYYFSKEQQIWAYGLDWLFNCDMIVFSGHSPTPSNKEGLKLDLWITHVNEQILRRITGKGNNFNPSWSAAGEPVEILQTKASRQIPWEEILIGTVQLLSPSNGVISLGGNVAFTWHPVNNATKYQFILYNSRGQVTLNTTLSRLSITVTLGIEEIIAWKVRAGDNNGNWGAWSNTWRMNVEGIPWLGVNVQDMSPEIAKFLGLDKVEGVIIEDIVKGSPAEEAGLKRGDSIYSINGKKVNTPQELQALFMGLKIGDKVEIRIIRDGKEISLIVKIGKKPSEE